MVRHGLQVDMGRMIHWHILLMAYIGPVLESRFLVLNVMLSLGMALCGLQVVKVVPIH